MFHNNVIPHHFVLPASKTMTSDTDAEEELEHAMSTEFVKQKPSLSKRSFSQDSRISFREDTHKYRLDGYYGPTTTSVTGLIHQFEEEFDNESVIAGMKTKPEWGDPSDPKYGKYASMTDQQIVQSWKDNANDASRKGRAMHMKIESFYNEQIDCMASWKPFDWEAKADALDDSPEMCYFRDLNKKIQTKTPNGLDLTPFRSEWMVFDGEHALTGSIDMVYLDKTDPLRVLVSAEGISEMFPDVSVLDLMATFLGRRQVWLFDWKRSKEIRTRGFGKMLKAPLSHWPACNFSTYSLQLNLYAWMLEKNYSCDVLGMKMVVIHPKNPTFRVWCVERQALEVRDVLALRKEQLRS